MTGPTSDGSAPAPPAEARGEPASRLRRARWGALIGLAAGLLATAAAYLPLVDIWERRTLDVRVRAFARAESADPGIVAVVIDQKSLDVIAAPRERGGLEQGWPWPRDYHAAVIRYLLDSGARAVAVDLVMSETSIYTRLGVAEDDAELGRVGAGRPVVHAAVFTREDEGEGSRADRGWPAGILNQPFTRAVDSLLVRTFNKATLPVGPLLNTTRGLGWIGFEPDHDGICRSIRPAAVYAPVGSPEALEIWSLPLALVAVLDRKIEVLQGRPAAARLAVDGRVLPIDEQGRLILRFHGGEDVYRRFSYVKVLESAKRAAQGLPVSEARPQDFRDKVVLVAANAAGLLDLRATSVGAVLPGYVIHAAALDNVLHGDAIRRPRAATRVALLLLVGVVCGVLVTLTRSVWAGALAALGTGVGCLALALALFDRRGLWLDVVPPALALVFAYGGASAYGYLTEGRERRFLRAAFSRYLAPEIVEELVAQPGRLALGGEIREMTVLFADVAGFTSLAEKADPRQLVELMNECFTEVTRVIHRHGGTVDKFIGDAVMAFWNAPIEHADHAARAARATRDLLDTMERLGAEWRERGLPTISMRVGMATGPSLVGNVGSQDKFNYTVMGDTVNLASRLEGAAKVYQALSLVAGSTVAAAGGAVRFRELDWLQVKGRSEPVTVYEVVRDGAGRDEAFARFAAGLAAYRERRFSDAVRELEAALAIFQEDGRDDGPSRELLERCLAFMLSPPPHEWRGERVLTEK
jgi:adenylate cyclase